MCFEAFALKAIELYFCILQCQFSVRVLQSTPRERLLKGSEKFALYGCLRYIRIGKQREKGSRDLLISEIANRINNISNHTKQICDLHCLCINILVYTMMRMLRAL